MREQFHALTISGNVGDPDYRVGVFRLRIKGSGRDEFFAEFLSNDKAPCH